VYSAPAEEAGVHRPVRTDDPRVVLGPISVGGQNAFVALNVSPEHVDATLVSPASPVHLASAPEPTPVDSLRLGPYEVALLYGL
jgi:hypothetical protein